MTLVVALGGRVTREIVFVLGESLCLSSIRDSIMKLGNKLQPLCRACRTWNEPRLHSMLRRF